jgi:hypothetical protein
MNSTFVYLHFSFRTARNAPSTRWDEQQRVFEQLYLPRMEYAYASIMKLRICILWCNVIENLPYLLRRNGMAM